MLTEAEIESIVSDGPKKAERPGEITEVERLKIQLFLEKIGRLRSNRDNLVLQHDILVGQLEQVEKERVEFGEMLRKKYTLAENEQINLEGKIVSTK